MKREGSSKGKRPYRSPGLRVYGPMQQLTHTMWWGLYPDHLGNVTNEPTTSFAPGMSGGKGGDMKKKMFMS